MHPVKFLAQTKSFSDMSVFLSYEIRGRRNLTITVPIEMFEDAAWLEIGVLVRQEAASYAEIENSVF